MWRLLLPGLLLGLSASAVAATEQWVIVMRHGVRAPTQSVPTQSAWTRKALPDWPVGRGELTPRGAALLTAQWQALGQQAREAGLLPGQGCPPPGGVHVRADTDERTQASAAALLQGLAPGCGLKFAVRSEKTTDPLFHPVKAGVCRYDRQQVTAALQPQLPGLQQTLQPSLQALQMAGGCCTPSLCQSLDAAGRCVLPLLPSRIHVSADRQQVSLHGGLGIAASLAENLLLTAAEWPQGVPAGVLGVTAEQLPALLPAHAAAFRFVNGSEPVARPNGSALLDQVLRTLQDPQAAPLTVLVGHDTNIANLAGLLDLHWHISPYARDEIPPGSGLLFRRRSDLQEGEQVSIAFFTPSLASLTRPDIREERPQASHLPVPGCGGKDCPARGFALLGAGQVDPGCVPPAQATTLR